jgi:hypothetical protein
VAGRHRLEASGPSIGAARQEDPAEGLPGDPGTVNSTVVGEDSVFSALLGLLYILTYLPYVNVLIMQKANKKLE